MAVRSCGNKKLGCNSPFMTYEKQRPAFQRDCQFSKTPLKTKKRRKSRHSPIHRRNRSGASTAHRFMRKSGGFTIFGFGDGTGSTIKGGRLPTLLRFAGKGGAKDAVDWRKQVVEAVKIHVGFATRIKRER